MMVQVFLLITQADFFVKRPITLKKVPVLESLRALVILAMIILFPFFILSLQNASFIRLILLILFQVGCWLPHVELSGDNGIALPCDRARMATQYGVSGIEKIMISFRKPSVLQHLKGDGESR